MEIVPGLDKLSGVGQGVNAYLWHPAGGTDDGPMVFDCGWPWSGRGLVASLNALGCQAADIRAIAITHDDIDHTGRLAPLYAVSGAEIIAHELEAPRLIRNTWREPPGNVGSVKLMRMLAHLAYGRWRHQPVRVSRPVRDGDALPGGWFAVHTPGHTPGHTSYFHPRLGVLIGGDALGPGSRGNLRFPMAIYTEDRVEAARSIRKLAELQPQILCLGHGPVLYGAAGVLRKFAESLEL